MARTSEQLTAGPPSPGDTFIIATDTRLITDCRNCVPLTLRVDDVAQTITRLYGVPSDNITNTTFSELKSFFLMRPTRRTCCPPLIVRYGLS